MGSESEPNWDRIGVCIGFRIGVDLESDSASELGFEVESECGVREYVNSVAESGSRLGLIREPHWGPTWDRFGDENWDPNWNRFGVRIGIRNDID